MPHDDEEIVAFHSAAIREHARLTGELVALRVENDQLRAYLIDLLRVAKETETILRKVLDKDHK